MTNSLVKIGFVSGLNYGSDGCREGFWRLAAKIFEREAVNYVVLDGGLVDGKAQELRLKACLTKVKLTPAEKVRRTDEFIAEVSDYLAENLPKITGVKIYMITSPAYDKGIGERISRYLVERRRDIILYREGGDRMEIKQINQVLGVYAPKKSVWLRGDYFDTPVLRVLKDEKKRSRRGLGDTNVVGCFASSLLHPGDSSDIGRPYFSLPILSTITEMRTAENQIGVRILVANSQNLKEATVVTYNFKDLASEEWALVQAPPDSSDTQKKLIDTMNARGPLTIGQFADFTSLSRDEIQKALDALIERRRSKSWPRIVKDKDSRRYNFNLDWFKQDLDYPPGEFENCSIDSIIAFGCLHAGCKHTDMKYFRDEVPQIILAQGITTLAGGGDFIEGLRHDLMIKGEVYGSRRFVFNYTHMEKLGAYLLARLILQVFEVRIASFLKESDAKVTQEILEAEVRKALLLFLFIAGNHCEWVKPLGFDALETLYSELKKFLVLGVGAVLKTRGLTLHNLDEVVHAKVVRLEQDELYRLPSGTTISFLHPSMSRTKTTSIRPQEMLQKANTQIVIGANFHVAEALEQWEFEKGGQRVCLQVGTIKHRSGFEDSKLKIVDFGVGMLKAWSKDGRIKKTETAFYGTRTPNLKEANEAILQEFEDYLEQLGKR